MRPHTARRDHKILQLWRHGRLIPKEIMVRLHLSSVGIVYQAIKRANIPHGKLSK